MQTTIRRASVAAVAAASAAALATGCDTGSTTTPTTRYAVSGTVEARQIEQECTTVQHRPISGALMGKPRPADPAPADPAPAAPPRVSKPQPSSAPARPRNSAPAPAATVDTGKVSKWTPPAPREINPNDLPKAPAASPTPPRRGSTCATEYELFIKNRHGIFEQDVTEAHYRRCTEGAKFSTCTTD